MARHYPGAKIIYLPTPTWGNHIPLFKDSGLEVRSYRYFDKKTVGLDFDGLKEDLKVCPRFRCVVISHAVSRTPQKVQLCFCTPVHTIPPGLIPRRRNGRSSLMSLPKKSSSRSLTWHTRALLPARRHGTPLPSVTLFRKATTWHYASRLPRTWGSMASALALSHSPLRARKRRSALKVSSRLSSAPCTRTHPYMVLISPARFCQTLSFTKNGRAKSRAWQTGLST